jgi:hypothetical protein
MDRQQLHSQPRDTRSGDTRPGEGQQRDRHRSDRPQADLVPAPEQPEQLQPAAPTAALQPAGSAPHAAMPAAATEAAEANPDISAAAAAPLGFAQAIEITGRWLAAWEAGELSEEVLADRVAQLVASRDGARGFFVVALAGDSPLLDRLPEPLLLQLRRAGAPLIDLTARNLAMSSAMAVAHGRGGDRQQRAGSERVQARATELLRQLEPGGVRQRLETLLAAARDQQGEDVAFLERWGYDAEQRQGIVAAIEAVATTA